MTSSEKQDIVLLAVDLGLRCGFAGYTAEGRLAHYASKHFPNRSVLRKAVYGVVGDFPNLSRIIIEGGGDLALPWEKEACRRGITVQRVAAETWRAELLLQRNRRTGKDAKLAADELARAIIEEHGAKRPTSLRHDAAEAILVGYWATGRSRSDK